MDIQALATRGQGAYRQYRIPALAVTPSGRLIALYDGRPDLDDLPGPIDLLIRVSDDNGTSWSPESVLLSHDGIAGFGDASIVIDPAAGEHGRIFVFAQATQLAGFFEGSFGTDADDPTVAHIELLQSDDDGASWSRRRVTAQFRSPDIPAIFASSGMGGRIEVGPFAGRLLQTFVMRRNGELLAAVGYSDDHGDSWSLGADIPGGNESAAIGLHDGTVLVHSRATPYRLTGRSSDGGLTLDALGPDLALPDPSDNGSLCVLSSGAVVCTHNHDFELRRRTVVKRSTDGGRTWPEAVVLEPGSSAYSTACELPDGRIGVLFERMGYAEMAFCRIDPDDFGPTEQVLPLEVDDDGVEFTVALRYVRPARIAALPAMPADRRMPAADKSVWEAFERKEVGTPGEAADAAVIHTREEFDVMLGPVHPGLHVGDELRFSGRLANLGSALLRNVVIECAQADEPLTRHELAPGERLVFLDVRYVVTELDLVWGTVTLPFTWRGTLCGANGESPRAVGGTSVQTLSTATGLPVGATASR